MIDVQTESLLTLRQAAKRKELQRNGRPPHLSALYRWAAPDGVRGARLETVVVGGSRCTSVEAILRFIERLSADPARDVNHGPSPSQRQIAFRRAEKALESAGI